MEFPKLSSLIDEGFALQPPKKWPTYLGGRLDRRGYVSSSEIGNCERRIKYAKSSDQSGKLKRWGYAERGVLIEEWAVDLIREAIHNSFPDFRLMFAGQNQFSFVDGVQSGTPDGLLVHTDTHEGVCVEIKAVDPRTNFSRLPKPKHVLQTVQNIILLDRLTPYTVKTGMLLYINASDLQHRHLVPVERTPEVEAALEEKARRILEASGPDELEPAGLYMDKECDQCEFTEQCSAQINSEKLKTVDMTKHERAMENVFKR